MGITVYLVDYEGKNALCCEKWYALQPEEWDNVTAADINAARTCDKLGDEAANATADLALAWIRDVAGGRPVGKRTDSADQMPWQTEHYEPIPGWTMYEGAGEGVWRACRVAGEPLPALPHGITEPWDDSPDPGWASKPKDDAREVGS